MAKSVISDEQVIGALKVVVKGSGPLLDALTDTDPLGLKKRTYRRSPVVIPGGPTVNLKDRVVRTAVNRYYRVKYPGTAAWQRMSPQQRTFWWMSRVGRFTSLVAAVPGLGGAVADRFPVQDALGAAGQAVLLCAVSREWGVTEPADQVRLLAWVLCKRELSRQAVGKAAAPTDDQLRRSGVDPDQERAHRKARPTVVGAARALWRYGRVLRSIAGELEKRPHARWGYRMVGKVPLVGVLGAYLGERSALKRAVRQADEWVRANRHTMG